MKSTLKHIFFKAGLKLFFFLGKVLTRSQLPVVSKIIGSLFYVLPWSRKKVALNNIKIAFEKIEEKKAKKLLKTFLQEVVLIALEIAFIIKKRDSLSNWAIASGIEYLEGALKKGRGVIALSGHIGNIPAMLAWLSEKGYPTAVLFKEGKYLPKGFLYNLIRSYKIHPVPFRSDDEVAKEIIRALNKNMLVFILADQARKGIYAKFFGKLVQCQRGAFVIALRKKTPLVPIFIFREKNCYRIKIYPELKQKINGDSEEIIKDGIEQYNSLLESLIRQHPEQWYWFHRRFKNFKPL